MTKATKKREKAYGAPIWEQVEWENDDGGWTQAQEPEPEEPPEAPILKRCPNSACRTLIAITDQALEAGKGTCWKCGARFRIITTVTYALAPEPEEDPGTEEEARAVITSRLADAKAGLKPQNENI